MTAIGFTARTIVVRILGSSILAIPRIPLDTSVYSRNWSGAAKSLKIYHPDLYAYWRLSKETMNVDPLTLIASNEISVALTLTNGVDGDLPGSIRTHAREAVSKVGHANVGACPFV